MADVLLINPPYSDIYGKINVKRMGFSLPSLGLAYIGSFLKSHDKDVELIDATFIEGGLEGLFKKIKEEAPRIVGFTVVTANMSVVARMAEEIKKISPQTLIVVGGFHPSALPAETVNNYKAIDIAVIGEGEFTMLDLCEFDDLTGIKGICYRNESDEIKINEPRPLMEDLDSLPFPLFEHLLVYKYGYLSLGNALPVLSGRGCPYNCSFCASNVINQRRCRLRNSSKFVEELECLIARYKINRFVFCDESFTFDKKRTIEICEEIINKNLNIRWSCMMRVDNASPELLKIMKEAGCQMIEIGIESADDLVLEKSNKKIELQQVIQTVNLANKMKLEINAFFILGLPFETPESIERTIDFSKRLKVDYAQFSMFVPLPGSAAWNLTKGGNGLRCTARDWDDFARYKKPIVESDMLSSETLYSLYNRAIRSFYLRPYTLWKTLRKINSLERMKNFWNAGLTMLDILKSR
ncbi:MAG: B12-binding domain-containing radical SAM protein [Candidatus Omnitrophica bacterium]|nr:B12-binding domain-containing radical SAM protein [Candidatus Omnitrophota bacterium]